MDKKGKLALVSALLIVGLLVLSMAIAKPNPRAAKACNDKIDNDGDGYCDYAGCNGMSADPGCTSRQDTTETDPNVECDDGSDNDGDSAIDYNDNGCSGPTDNDETDCGDGVCEGGEVCDTCIADCGHCDSCSDTDGGNVISVFGTASGYYNDVWYSDGDYCVDSSNILEYYCSGDYEQSSQQSCGTDGYGSSYCIGNDIYQDLTDYFCASGECDSNVTPEFKQDCDDSDGYGSNYCLNSSVYKDYNNYYCSGGACDYSATPELVEECTYGCTAGECDGIPDSCSDTDYGMSIYTQGTVSGYLNETYYEDTDYCLNSTTLLEFYCSGDYEYDVPYPCPAGNLSGICVSGVCT
ncbi:MAG: hypothetical protein KAK00_07545 [Nanoarchaeota archaeon]|nr:hypothetical protein [Nanoarchaeota archaeon]